MAEMEISALRDEIGLLENELESLQKRTSILESSVSEIVALGKEFWRSEAAEILLGAAVTSWCYDARQESALFTDISPCEAMPGGIARRWVGRSGELAATIVINRSTPLIFSATIMGTALPQLEDTLRLEVDGHFQPWTTREEKIVAAEIEERPGHTRLSFRLSIDKSLLSVENKFSFSFSELRFAQLPFGSLRRHTVLAIASDDGHTKV